MSELTVFLLVDTAVTAIVLAVVPGYRERKKRERAQQWNDLALERGWSILPLASGLALARAALEIS
ncbi:MAG: hypothetical protein HY784_18730 [Chloroflexi bacterium]|nr:hypothetical protein [Chloroflexota bacterium]